MTTPKPARFTLTITQKELATLRAGLNALEKAHAAVEYARNIATPNLMHLNAKIEAAGRALDAAILPLNEWEALTDDLEAVRAMKGGRHE